MRRIVLTGGPGAGKTVIASHLAAKYANTFVLVPEAATQVHRRLGTHWSRLDPPARRDVQRQIHQLQLEQEQAFSAANPHRSLLFDRGTVDGAAYWPDGPDDYWQQLGTTPAAEYARYDAAIWLQTSAAIGAYDGGTSNPVRHENPDAAIAIGQKLHSLWSAHPRFHQVEAFPSIRQKIAAVETIIQTILASASE
jgi:predicted ATPase